MFGIKNKKGGNVWVAVSIIVAGLIIAGAVMLSNSGRVGSPQSAADPNRQDGFGDISEVRAPNENDHIRGSLDAPIIIVEYSDTECPFCAVLHETLKQIIPQYEGQVAWVYRHLPLTQLYPQAIIESHALECAAEIGGNDGFWSYADRLFEITPQNRQIDLAELPKIAEFVDIDVNQFNDCMESERHLSVIEEDFNEAVKAAGDKLGTPFNIIFAPNDVRIPISGALPAESWIQIIDSILANI